MLNSVPSLDVPKNEPVRGYLPGSPEKASLKARLKAMASETIEIPLIVGGKEIRTGKIEEHRCPHDHAKVLARFHMATPEVIEQAVQASQEAWADWSELPVQNRARGVPARGGAARRAVARHGQRRDDARPVEDRATRPRSTRRAS